MALKKPKKPKYKAYPKTPKATASSDVWKRFEARAKEVSAANQKTKAEYDKKVKAYESEMKARERIKEHVRSAKSKL